MGGWWPWCSQSEEPNLSTADPWPPVPWFWLCSSRQLSWPWPRGSQTLALLWQIQNENPQHYCKQSIYHISWLCFWCIAQLSRNQVWDIRYHTTVKKHIYCLKQSIRGVYYLCHIYVGISAADSLTFYRISLWRPSWSRLVEEESGLLRCFLTPWGSSENML